MESYLQHHGIKGQRWYHRRFQNPDGSLTPEGKIRYANKAWDKVSRDDASQRAAAKDAAFTVIGIHGKYGTQSEQEKERYYQDMTDAYRAGKLKIQAAFERDYDDGSVMCKFQDIPMSRLIVGRHGQIIRQVNEELIPAIQDYYDFLNRNKSKLADRNFTFENERKRSMSSEQRGLLDGIKSFSPQKPSRRFFDEDEAVEYFNKQFDEKFGDVNLNDHPDLLDAYDDKLIDFLDDAFS